MQKDRQDKTRERAYEIWEQGGRPHGQAEEHWSQAERELSETDAMELARQDASSSAVMTPEGVPDAPPKEKRPRARKKPA